MSTFEIHFDENFFLNFIDGIQQTNYNGEENNKKDIIEKPKVKDVLVNGDVTDEENGMEDYYYSTDDFGNEN